MGRSVMIGAAALAVAVFGMAAPAGAAEDLVIPIDSVVRNTPFSTVEVGNVTVDEDLVGDSCEVTLVGANNESVHDGNDLIVSTGDDRVTFSDVESESFQESTAAGEVVLGESVVVQLELGQDGISSGGLSVEFDCEEPVTTTTTTEAPATTTTEAPTTTEVPVDVLAETQVAAPQPGTAVQPTASAAGIGFTG